MTNRYQPDFAIHPGEHLNEMLETSGMTQAELAARLGIHKKTINEIIKGKTSLTSDVALRLSKVFHYPAHLWNNLQRNYDETLVRLAEQERLEQHLHWLKQVPVQEMVKRNWISLQENAVDQLNEVLRFFGIAAPEQWQSVWKNYQVAYRQTKTFEPSAMAMSVWLRRGEIESEAMAIAPYSAKDFSSLLDDIRSITALEPAEFQPKLIQRCATVGVAVVFVPDLPKTGISGATRWVHGRPVIQLSLRYKSNDHLWFTFFHEAAHILKHGKKEIFLEGNGMSDTKEQEIEADNFARDKLIPPSALQQLLESGTPTLEQIKTFATQQGIAPGIVVGRLQHDGILDKKIGNGLKVFYRWKSENEK